jgi:hypothetical protein
MMDRNVFGTREHHHIIRSALAEIRTTLQDRKQKRNRSDKSGGLH